MKKIILSAALIAAGFTCSFAASVEDMAKDALINGGSYEVMGTFGAYDFDPKGDNDKFDWAFTMNGKSYQLRGNRPSDTDVFGWKPVDIVAPTPAWYMFQVDVDGDGTMGKFDWVLLGASSNYATKLKGVADNGSFDYTGKLDVDYKVDASGAVTAGAVGTLEEVEEPAKPETPQFNGTELTVKSANDVKGYTFTSAQGGATIKATYTVDFKCDGSFVAEGTFSYGGNSYVEKITDNRVELGSWFDDNRIEWTGKDEDDELTTNYIYINSDDKIVVNESCFVDSDCANGFTVIKIEQTTTCN